MHLSYILEKSICQTDINTSLQPIYRLECGITLTLAQAGCLSSLYRCTNMGCKHEHDNVNRHHSLRNVE